MNSLGKVLSLTLYLVCLVKCLALTKWSRSRHLWVCLHQRRRLVSVMSTRLKFIRLKLEMLALAAAHLVPWVRKQLTLVVS